MEQEVVEPEVEEAEEAQGVEVEVEEQEVGACGAGGVEREVDVYLHRDHHCARLLIDEVAAPGGSKPQRCGPREPPILSSSSLLRCPDDTQRCESRDAPRDRRGRGRVRSVAA